MKKYLLYCFLIIISNPYQGINYNEINVYDVNYCSDYCYNQNNSDWGYFEDEQDSYDNQDIEELEDELRDEYEKEEKPAPFNLDFWLPTK